MSTDTGNYSCEPSNAESDTVQVHVLEGTGMYNLIRRHRLELNIFYFKGGLPRANVMANESVKVTCSNILILLLFAFNCNFFQIQV